jgi:hypothetical protein
MENKKFLQEITGKLEQSGADEKVINFVIFKVKQSFRNGVEVGTKQALAKAAKAKGNRQ